MPAPPEAAPSGAATRVVDVQRQAAATLRLSVAFVVTAPVAALGRGGDGAWMPLHLFLVGGVLLAISAATQMLAVTWSASPAPADTQATVQRWSIAAGALAIVVGRSNELTPVVAAGGTAVVVGLVLLAHALVTIRRTSGNARFHPAIDGYLLAVGWALLGAGLGITMAVTDPGEWWLRVRDAHLAANLLGLVGLVIASTLPFFVATQARTKMSPSASPRALRATLAALGTGVAAVTIGHVLDLSGLVALGYLAYAAGLVHLLRLLPALGRRQLDWAGPRLVQLGAGVAWWIGCVTWLAVGALDTSVDTTRATRALVVGGFAQILVASLAYLGPVLRGGGHQRLSAGFATTRSWASLAAGNVAAVAIVVGAGGLAVAALVTWAATVTVRAVQLGVSTDKKEDRRSPSKTHSEQTCEMGR